MCAKSFNLLTSLLSHAEAQVVDLLDQAPAVMLFIVHLHQKTNVEETCAFGDYGHNDSEIGALMASHNVKEEVVHHDFDITKTEVAAAPENIMLLAKQRRPNEQNLNGDERRWEQGSKILKEFNATKRPGFQGYTSVSCKRRSSTVIGLSVTL